MLAMAGNLERNISCSIFMVSYSAHKTMSYVRRLIAGLYRHRIEWNTEYNIIYCTPNEKQLIARTGKMGGLIAIWTLDSVNNCEQFPVPR